MFSSPPEQAALPCRRHKSDGIFVRLRSLLLLYKHGGFGDATTIGINGVGSSSAVDMSAIGEFAKTSSGDIRFY